MGNENRKYIIVSLIIYVLIICVMDVCMVGYISIAPLMYKYTYEGMDYYVIESVVRELFRYIEICFIITSIYAIFMKERFVAMFISGWIIVIVMSLYNIILLLFYEYGLSFLVTVMIVATIVIMHNSKRIYKSTTLLSKLFLLAKKKRNRIIVFLILIIIIVVNLIYIYIPKSNIYVYTVSDQFSYHTYKTEGDSAQEVFQLEVGEDTRFGINPSYFSGWVFEAVEEGETEIYIGTADGRMDNDYTYEKTVVMVDSNLKFVGVPSMEYIRMFYRFNICMILFGALYIVLLIGNIILYKISKEYEMEKIFDKYTR